MIDHIRGTIADVIIREALEIPEETIERDIQPQLVGNYIPL
jgi:hypothetical protein